MALGEAVVGERGELLDDLVLYVLGDAAFGHPRPQVRLDHRHRFLRPLEPHRPTQRVRLTGRESRQRHRHLHPLLLKERHAQRPVEDRLQIRMQISHRLLTTPAPHVRVHHIALDRARSDERYLDHQVVEGLRLESRQRVHLRTALDLEDADRVRRLDHPVDLLVVRR